VSKVTSVTFHGSPATGVDVIDDNRMQVVTPAAPSGPADVVVSNPNGPGTCLGCFRFQAALEVDSIEPARGPAQGGTPVTLHGKGFAQGMLLLIGGRGAVGLMIVDAQTATAITPPGAPGGADVLALTADSTGELRRGFVYAQALALDDVQPRVGTAGAK